MKVLNMINTSYIFMNKYKGCTKKLSPHKSFFNHIDPMDSHPEPHYLTKMQKWLQVSKKWQNTFKSFAINILQWDVLYWIYWCCGDNAIAMVCRCNEKTKGALTSVSRCLGLVLQEAFGLTGHDKFLSAAAKWYFVTVENGWLDLYYYFFVPGYCVWKPYLYIEMEISLSFVVCFFNLELLKIFNLIMMDKNSIVEKLCKRHK